MHITEEQIRAYRLRAHHLDERLPMDGMLDAAGVCGLQNTPPGAWETALHNRLDGCTLQALHAALYQDKTLLQAWAYRGAPVVFPTALSDVFLTPLIAQADESPWIYTLGITGALAFLQMPFDDLLARLKDAIAYLDHHTVKSKEALDQTLADIIQERLPGDKQALWRAPSMYGNPQRQTVGGAAVSFLLRPCAFASLVVFGRREGISPTFTSFRRWTGHAPVRVAEADRALTRKFLHAYGPATVDAFIQWLGCSTRQAHRLWRTVADEIVPVQAQGKTRYMLAADMDALASARCDADRLMLLGAHDPYLDIRDRAVILADAARQKIVWQYVANPGAVAKGGRIIGIWKAKTLRDKVDVTITAWEAVSPAERRELERLVEAYAAFRLLRVHKCVVEEA